MPPPQQPIRNNHVNLLQTPNKLPIVPDLLLTALSICFLFSSSAKITILPKTPFFNFPSCPRRFGKLPTMSLHHHRNFATPQSLSDWLKPRLRSDSLASWGVKPGTKNVHNLWLELSEGESSLVDSTPPIRTVHVVTVRVIDDQNRVLVEAHQELSDGSIRSRGRPLSEKMKPDEDRISAANRAIMEDLDKKTCEGEEAKKMPKKRLKKMTEKRLK